MYHTPRPTAAPGRLLVLEGLDGAGTTTQARSLVETLRAQGHEAYLTREPSDGPIGRLIREMLTGRHAIPDAAIDPKTFALLFAADRMDHLQREVGPALARGAIVVSDRWYHSTYAYQAMGTAELPWLQTLNRHAWIPDLTIFLAIRPEVAAARRVAAGRVQELFEDLPTQQRVAAGYVDTLMVLDRHERIHVLDGELPLATITAQVTQAVLDYLAA